MARRTPGTPSTSRLFQLTLKGFKSFRDETEIEMRPLTILAGANSSGKSSAMQALLLLKQTLEAPYDPGPFLLNGRNVRLTSMDQIRWRGLGKSSAPHFEIGLKRGVEEIRLLAGQGDAGPEVRELRWTPDPNRPLSGVLRERMTEGEVLRQIRTLSEARHFEVTQPIIRRERFYFTVEADLSRQLVQFRTVILSPFLPFIPVIANLVHLPGLRGNPERTYPATGPTDTYPGQFQDYTASVIARWMEDKDRLEALGAWLTKLGLTWKAQARRVDDANVEILVGRLGSPRRGCGKDLVNIADVGFGVSQALPVVVALLAAGNGQIVYIEQPEIHLHPKAQVALAELLADAAKRGVIVVAETHSEMLLLGIQEQVATGSLPASHVKLHWFQRDRDGATRVTPAELDENGTYGDWPEDFADVSLEIQDRFLTATARKRGA